MNDKKDLLVLVPDKNVQIGMGALLSRHQSLNIRQITFDIFVHLHRDPGVYHGAGNFLKLFSQKYLYALVFIDREGSGQENKPAENIALEIKTSLESAGWANRVEVIVFDPEFEIWVWTESPHTAYALGWKSYSELKNWLINKGLWEHNSVKPKRPKEAVEKALEEKRIPRSSSIYKEIAQKVSLNYCQDKSFIKLKNILQKWFPRKAPK